MPQTGEQLLFPQGAPLATTNDLPGTLQLGLVTVDDAYVIDGNDLELAGGIHLSVPATINNNVRLVADQTFDGRVRFGGSFDVGGFNLKFSTPVTFDGPIEGSGAVNPPSSPVSAGAVTLNAGSNGFTGTINSSTLTLNSASTPGASVTAGIVVAAGESATGNLTASQPGGVGQARIKFDDSGATRAVLHAGSVSFPPAGPFSVFPNEAYQPGLDFSASDQIDAHGSVSLFNAWLDVQVLQTPAPGHVYTIVSNDGSDPIDGIFQLPWKGGPVASLPEGSELEAGGARFRISYVGGDGNDVTLTVVGQGAQPTTTALTATADGDTVTLTANVTAGAGTPSGTVDFSDGGSHLGTTALINGQATLMAVVSNAPHTFTATYSGDASFAGSSDTAQLDLTRAATVTSLAGGGISVYGQSVSFTASVQPAAATGTVSFVVDGRSEAPAPVVNGSATFSTTSLRAGTHSLRAIYNGDATYGQSSSASAALTVKKAQTSMHASTTPSIVSLPSTVSVSVALSVAAPGGGTPSGNVTTLDNGVVVSDQALSGVFMSISLWLTAQKHTLTIRYGGDDNFEASSTTLPILPAPPKRRAVR